MGKIHRATPLRTVFMHRVVISGGTFSRFTPRPFSAPTSTPVKITAAAPSAICTGLLVFISLAATAVHTLMLEATLRSMPPEMMTSVCPMATQASGTHWVSILVMLYSERKDSEQMHITINTRTSSR